MKQRTIMGAIFSMDDGKEASPNNLHTMFRTARNSNSSASGQQKQKLKMPFSPKPQGWKMVFNKMFKDKTKDFSSASKSQMERNKAVRFSESMRVNTKLEILEDTHNLWSEVGSGKAQEIKHALKNYINHFKDIEQVKSTMHSVKQHLVIEIK